MIDNLSKKDIFEMVRHGKMKSEEALMQFKKIHAALTEPKDSEEIVYYSPDMVREDVDPEVEKTLSGNILIFETDESLSGALKAEMGQRGNVVSVKPGTDFEDKGNNIFQINPGDRQHYLQLMNSLHTAGIMPDKVLHLWSGDEFSRKGEALKSSLTKGIYSTLFLLRELMEQKPKNPIKFLYGYFAKGDSIQPQHSAINGFIKSVAKENPIFVFKTVELRDLGLNEGTSPELLANILKYELNAEGANQVCYQGETRFIRQLNKFDFADNAESPLKTVQEGVYLITGGAGGLGFEFAKHLAKTEKAKLVLAGRSELGIDKEQRLETLRDMGSEVIYIKCDISKKYEAEMLIREAKAKFKGINGIIHCAGVIQDSFVLKKTADEMENVFSPKIYGTINIDEASKNEKLDFFVLFSSTTAELGNTGQSDYAFSNSFMDYYARLRQKEGRPGKTLSINWPFWKNGGMKVGQETLDMIRESTGMSPLDTEEGIKAFQLGLCSDKVQFLVVKGDDKRIREMLQKTCTIREVRTATPTSMEDINGDELKTHTETYLKTILSKEIRLAPAKIDPNEPMEKYGIDSVMVMNLTRELEKHFGDLPKTLFFEYQSISELTNYFIDKHFDKLIDKIGSFLKPKAKQELTSPVERKAAAHVKRPRFASRVTREPSVEARTEDDDIAVIGLSGRYPMAGNVEEFWENLKVGNDCITEIPQERWNYKKDFDPHKEKKGKSYSKWGGFIDDVDKFDPLFFNISPKEAEILDPQERIFLQNAWHTFEDAGYPRDMISGKAVGVFVGVMYGQYQLYGAEESMKGNNIGLQSSHASIANRVSYFFNLNGPSIGLDTMCSSSLTAIHLACESLKRNETEMALAGGVNVSIHPNKYIFLSQGKFVSSEGKCRAFGKGGDGYVPGEGVGSVLLKSLKKAVADGDRIYAVIKSVSVNHDGKTNGYTVPNPNAQAKVISNALKKAKINPREISYIEAHGTGTSLGDPIEIAGITKAFEEFTKDKQFCAIGSSKSNIGHLESAAGIAAVTKLLLQFKHKQLVPSIHSEELNPNISFTDTPFVVQNSLEEWKKPVINEKGISKTCPRVAGVSSFGAGGANAHIIFEEYEGNLVIPKLKKEGSKIFVLSAKNVERLNEYAGKVYDYLCAKGGETDLTAVVYTLQLRRDEMEERLAIEVADMNELKAALGDYCNGKRNNENIYTGNIKESKSQFEFLLNGIEGDRFVKTIIEEAKYSKLAQLWVAGIKIDWGLLYTTESATPVELPLYPFSKEHYWVPISNTSKGEFGKKEKIHALLGVNISNLKEQMFKTEFIGDELLLSEHIVGGQKLLPGAAYIEMALVAAEISAESKVARIKNIVWAKPFVIGEKPKDIHISLHAKGGEVEYEVFTATEFDRIVHSKGRISFSPHNNSVYGKGHIDIEAIKSRCFSVTSTEECYKRFSGLGFDYGNSFRTIKELYSSNSESLACLELPESFDYTADCFTLHPLLLDGAFQTVSGLVGNMETEGIYYPFALGRLEIRARLQGKCYAWARSANGEGAGSKVRNFDIDIVDEAGNLIAGIKDFSLKAAEKKNVGGKGDKEVMEMLNKLYEGELKSDQVAQYMGVKIVV
ncbi:type I polyketide synthase [Ruminiclostridium cellulolyticum]|uniref:Beta-ketoacyl synthase n=1 Tax=Ruminiclostridium cellulolyticum (strain ATCC 35319 / DSM 5812 / JCM 6584 / H10) TaxID=394503 RepID=B8I8J8_RUMCH|nr:type I polyketide synthase [Ruminiclostridium cellulolyticum]ACL75231.1 Beta-ketoacyl synthase [Ruminiclostridium cellulolyticum H10]